eukprot:6189461-Pleurochrysis_carterae.AAC.2
MRAGKALSVAEHSIHNALPCHERDLRLKCDGSSLKLKPCSNKATFRADRQARAAAVYRNAHHSSSIGIARAEKARLREQEARAVCIWHPLTQRPSGRCSL